MTDDKLKKDLTDIFAKTFGKVPEPAKKAIEDLSLRRPPAGGSTEVQGSAANPGTDGSGAKKRRRKRRKRSEAPQCRVEGCSRPVLARVTAAV